MFGDASRRRNSSQESLYQGARARPIFAEPIKAVPDCRGRLDGISLVKQRPASQGSHPTSFFSLRRSRPGTIRQLCREQKLHTSGDRITGRFRRRCASQGQRRPTGRFHPAFGVWMKAPATVFVLRLSQNRQAESFYERRFGSSSSVVRNHWVFRSHSRRWYFTGHASHELTNGRKRRGLSSRWLIVQLLNCELID